MVSLKPATIIGSLWYGPLFGKAWMAEIGKTPDDLKAGQVPAMASAFIANFIAATILSATLVRFQTASVGEALVYGFLLWLAFTGGQQFMADRFHIRSIKLSLINGGITLLTFLAMAAVIQLMS